MLDHVGLLSEGSVTDLTHEGLLSGVNFQMLLEVESLAVDEQSAHWTAFVVAPMVIHMRVKVVQIADQHVALDAIQRPKVVLNLSLVFAHLFKM